MLEIVISGISVEVVPIHAVQIHVAGTPIGSVGPDKPGLEQAPYGYCRFGTKSDNFATSAKRGFESRAEAIEALIQDWRDYVDYDGNSADRG